MPLSFSKTLIVVLVAAACTFATRLIPFIFFGGKKEVPKFIKYLGDILPMAIIGVLIIYCLGSIETGDIKVIAPQLIGVAITSVMHIWKKNTLLSIAVGTISYMLLIHFVFI